MTADCEARVRGTVYGQAVGDALGLPATNKSDVVVAAIWPDPTWPSAYQGTVRSPGSSVRVRSRPS